MAKNPYKNNPATGSLDDKAAQPTEKQPKNDKQDVHYEHASATLLAMQPNDTDKKPKVIPAEWNALRGHVEGRLVSLRDWRQSWWTQNWSLLAQYILPRRSIWLTQSTGGWPTPNNMTRGRPLNNSIVDPTGTFAVRVCSAGLMSGLASPSRPWFKVTTALKNFEPDAAGRAWMDEVEERVYTVLSGSNFYNSFAQECEDLVVFGTGPSIMYEDERDVIRCYNPCVGEYFLSSSATLRVDGLYRAFVYTVSQMVDFFGLENCPEDVKKLWAEKGVGLQQERIVAHAIEPNFDIEGCPRLPGNFAWREVYWVYGQGTEYPLSKRGFVDQPFTAGRWATQSNDAYGRSPGMDVLPDIIQLQVETMAKAEGIERGLRPPLLADMALKNAPTSALPSDVTFVPNLAQTGGMRSMYDVKFDLADVSADILAVQNRVKVGLFNDLFLMLTERPDQKMTAFEVQARLTEKMTVLGPVVENIITDSLKPKLKRVLSIMNRKGMLPPVPDSMKGIPLNVEFTSLLAVAQKASATGGLERIAALIGNMVAVFPEVKDILDSDKFVREFNNLLANPNDILRSPDDVQKLRAQAAQAAQQQHTAAMMAQGAQTINTGAQAAQTLASTDVGSGQTALNQMLGIGGGGK